MKSNFSIKMVGFRLSIITMFLFSLTAMSQAQEITGLELLRQIDRKHYGIRGLDAIFDDDRQIIVFGSVSGGSSADTLLIYDYAADKIISFVKGANAYYTIFISGDNQLLYANSQSLFRLDNFENPVVTELRNGIVNIAFNKELNTLAMVRVTNSSNVDYNATLFKYDPATGTLDSLINIPFKGANDHRQNNNEVAISPDADFMALSGGYNNNYVHLMNLKNGDYHKIETQIATGAYSPVFYKQDGRLLLAVGGSYLSGSIEIIDVESASIIAANELFPSYVYSIVLTSDQKIMAGGGFNGEIKLFRVEGSELTEFFSYQAGLFAKLIFAGNDNYLISAHGAGQNRSNVKIFRVLRGSSSSKSLNEDFLSVWPNPAEDILNIKEAAGGIVSVYDASGRMVIHKKITGETLHVNDLLPGAYHIVIQKDKSTYMGKFIKE